MPEEATIGGKYHNIKHFICYRISSSCTPAKPRKSELSLWPHYSYIYTDPRASEPFCHQLLRLRTLKELSMSSTSCFSDSTLALQLRVGNKKVKCFKLPPSSLGPPKSVAYLPEACNAPFIVLVPSVQAKAWYRFSPPP